MFKINPLTFVDSYKVGHINQYPAGTEQVYSNFTARSDKYGNRLLTYKGSPIVVFGIELVIQSYLTDLWNEGFFDQPKQKVVRKYHRRCSNLLGKDFDVKHIEDLHDLGFLPLKVKALPEGTICPIGVPFLTITNTLPQFYWLTNYTETALSNLLWPLITSATGAYYFRKTLEAYQVMTGSADFMVPYQGHDFAMRGMNGPDSSILCGLGHLTSFAGTDNLLAIDAAEEYYLADADTQHLGESVDATEHSVMTIGGTEGEFEVIEKLIDKNPKGILSMVLDGFDFFKAINEYLPRLKDKILARDGVCVIRPDSGNPVEIICGTAVPVRDDNGAIRYLAKLDGDKGYQDNVMVIDGVFYNCRLEPKFTTQPNGEVTIKNEDILKKTVIENPTLEMRGAVRILAEHFGTVTNDKGYKRIHPKLGLIYGDGITPVRAEEILSRLRLMGFESFPVFGLGSYFYQGCTRDTYGMAIKATAAVINGNYVPMFKDPKTDDGGKKSLKGYISVLEDERGNLYAVDNLSAPDLEGDKLEVVFHHAPIGDAPSLSEIRMKLWGWDDAK